MLVRLAKKLETKIEENRVVWLLVLAITIFNYMANALFPLLIIILGSANDAFHNVYINLAWGLILTAILIYCTQQTGDAHRKYFNDTVPAFLVSAYFLAVVTVFLIKTTFIFFAPMIDTFASTDNWLRLLNYISYIVEIYVLYAVCSVRSTTSSE